MFANLFAVLLFAAAAVLPSDVQTARELRLKSIREAETGLSVRLTGVITFCLPRGKYFYLQDGTGGVRVGWLADRELDPGDRVEVRGKTTAGSFLPEVNAKHVKVLAKASCRSRCRSRSRWTTPRTWTGNGWKSWRWCSGRGVHDGWLKFDLARGRGNAVVYVPLPLPARARPRSSSLGRSCVSAACAA